MNEFKHETEECEWCRGDGMDFDESTCLDCTGYGFHVVEEKEECKHEYKRAVHRSGMYFINTCHKCQDIKPWSYLDE